jgi:hypothetical protein
MVMLKEFKMEEVGLLHANTVQDNVKEISFKHVQLKKMTYILKPFHLSFVYKVDLKIGLVQEKDAPQPMD